MLSRPGSHSFGTIRLDNRSSILQNENNVQSVKKSMNSSNNNINPTKTPGTSKRRAFGDISNRKPLLQQQQTNGKNIQTLKKGVSFQIHSTTSANANTPSVRGLAPKTNGKPPKSSSKKTGFVLPQRIVAPVKTTTTATPRLKTHQVSKSITKAPPIDNIELKGGRSFDPFQDDDDYDDDSLLLGIQKSIDFTIKANRERQDGTAERNRVRTLFAELDAEFESNMNVMLAQVEKDDYALGSMMYCGDGDEDLSTTITDPIEDNLSLELESDLERIVIADDISM